MRVKTADTPWHIHKNPIYTELRCYGIADLVIKPFIFFLCNIKKVVFFFYCDTKSWILTVLYTQDQPRGRTFQRDCCGGIWKKRTCRQERVYVVNYTASLFQWSALLNMQNVPIRAYAVNKRTFMPASRCYFACLSQKLCLFFFKTRALSQLLPCPRTCRITDIDREEVRASLNDLSVLENVCFLFPLVEVWIISPLRAAFSLI